MQSVVAADSTDSRENTTALLQPCTMGHQWKAFRHLTAIAFIMDCTRCIMEGVSRPQQTSSQ